MAKASEWINRPNTICHYKRFSGFSKANCNACNVGAFKMVELLHLFAENGLPDAHQSHSAGGHGESRPERPVAFRTNAEEEQPVPR
jgi:hypothetical protein